MEADVIKTLVKFVKVGLLVLTYRALVIISLFMCAIGFGWALYIPNWERLAIVCAFACLVFWPIVRMNVAETKAKEKENEIS